MSSYEVVVHHINGVWAVISAVVSGFWYELHQGVIVRRAALFFSMVLTFKVTVFMGSWMTAALSSGMSGTEIGLVVAAVGAPVGAFQGSIFAFYSNGRKAADKS